MPLDDANPPDAAPAVSLDTIRQKYPQYDDMSDAALARGMHAKFYSDMPFPAFSAKIGYQPPAPHDASGAGGVDDLGRPIDQGQTLPPEQPLPRGNVGDGKPYQAGWDWRLQNQGQPDQPGTVTAAARQIAAPPPAKAAFPATPQQAAGDISEQTPSDFNQTGVRVPGQSWNTAVRNSALQGLGQGTGSIISTPGEVYRGAHADAAAAVLTGMDQIDKGTAGPAMFKGMGDAERSQVTAYMRAGPDDRAKMRAGMTELVANASTPNALTRAGAGLEAATQREFPVDQGQEGIGTTAGRMVGQMAPMVGAGMVGGAPAGLAMVGLQTFHDTRQKAVTKGATPQQADQAAAYSSLAAVGIFATPLGLAAKSVLPELSSGVLQSILEMGAKSGEFSVASAVNQAVENAVTRRTYDPKQSLTEGVLEAGIAGAVTGAAFGVPGVAHAVGQAAHDARLPIIDPALRRGYQAQQEAAAAAQQPGGQRLLAPTQPQTPPETPPGAAPPTPPAPVPPATPPANPTPKTANPPARTPQETLAIIAAGGDPKNVPPPAPSATPPANPAPKTANPPAAGAAPPPPGAPPIVPGGPAPKPPTVAPPAAPPPPPPVAPPPSVPWQAAHPDIPTNTFRATGRVDNASAYNGVALPILGGGRYSAFTPEHAAEFGPNVEPGQLTLKNPLIIQSDEQWRALTKAAGWEYPNPFGMPEPVVQQMTDRLKALVQSQGHDGIVVHWNDAINGDFDPATGGGIKNLRNVFHVPQVVDYRQQPAAAPAPQPPPATPPANLALETANPPSVAPGPTTPPPPPASTPKPPAAPPAAAPQPPAPTLTAPDNPLVTESRADQIRAMLRAKAAAMKAGIDPATPGTQLAVRGMDAETMQGGAELAVYYLERGVRNFADYARQIVADVGEEFRPYLRGWYENARYYPGLDTSDLTPHAEVDAEVARWAREGTDGSQSGGPGDGALVQPGGGAPGPGEPVAGKPPGNQPDQSLEGSPPTDVSPPASSGDTGEDGVRPGNELLGDDKAVPGGGNAGDGRGGTGDQGLVTDGAGSGADHELIPTPARANFHIDDPEALIGGTPKVRFARNRAALDALAAIEDEQRDPSPDELKTMAGYIGWGSFGQDLFQGTFERPRPRPGWDVEAQWLRDRLGREAWNAAQDSIANAHYTDPITVKAMWDMAAKMGFKGGRILEPSMGVGNFFGLMPRDIMAASTLTGIEMDPTTGAMAKLLYPDAGIHIKGYEESLTPDDFYDLVIGNWPFHQIGPVDRRYARFSPTLHNYFFLKALDQVRPGGLVIGITAKGTMDSAGRATRLELARKGELLGAFRLPSGAFAKYAGTDVVTDLLVLRKRAEPSPNPALEPWVNSTDMNAPSGGQIRVNQHYQDNPSAVLGTLDFGHGATQKRPGMIVHRPDNLLQLLQDLPNRVPADGYQPTIRGNEQRFLANNTVARQNNVVIHDNGKLYQVKGDQLQPLEVSHSTLRKGTAAAVKARDEQVRGLVGMRLGYGALIDAERDGKPETEALRTALAGQYAAFLAKHGTIAKSDGLTVLRRVDDPGWPMVAALERADGTPSQILSEPTVRSRRSMENPSIGDAYVLARNEQANFDIARVAELAKQPQAAVEQHLVDSGAVFRTPGGGFEPADSYLSGNVRRKLAEAQQALANGETAIQHSIDALTEVIPKTKPYYMIQANLGAAWVGDETYRQFVKDILNLTPDEAKTGVAINFVAARWKVRLDAGVQGRTEARQVWGHPRVDFEDLLKAAMGNTVIRIMDPADRDGGPYFNEKASEAANAKVAGLREKFSEWAWQDPLRKVQLEAAYNETMRAIAPARFDGSFMDMSGMALKRGNDPFSLRQHQVNGIWRGVVTGRGFFAHEVGTGKTYTMGGIAIEGRRYGVFRKPMLFAHNANSAAVSREIQQMYPGARIHYVDNLAPAMIKTTLHRIANEDWDLVVMPHSVMDKLALTRATLDALAAEQIAALESEAIDAAMEAGVVLTPEMMDGKPEDLAKLRLPPTAKDLVTARKRLKAKIDKMALRASAPGAVTFEQLGVDAIMVDEAHLFKKPVISTQMRVKGLNTTASNRSIALDFLTGYIKQQNNGRGVYLFSGTPITNTLNEVFNQSRYFMQDRMEAAGAGEWDTWFNTFADAENDVELTAAGTYEPVKRLAQFSNVDELVALMSEFTDVVQAKDMPEFKPRATADGKTLHSPDLSPADREFLTNGRTEKPEGRPYLRIINDVGQMSEHQRAILDDVRERVQSYRALSGKEKRELTFAHLGPPDPVTGKRTAFKPPDPRLPLITEADPPRASLDQRMYDPDLPEDPESKTNRVVRNVLRIYQEPKAAQAIFIDTGYNPAKSSEGRENRFVLVNDLIAKLVKGGIPRGEIALFGGGLTGEQKESLAQQMSVGTKRVAIGQTETMGTGVNMQPLLRAMHHMDAPWMPGDLEQRDGRGNRQGNTWNTVEEYRYITEGLDGKRWQVLRAKDNFIKKFISAFNDTSGEFIGSIEGDATEISDKEDVLASLSAAAGDPRIMQRAQYRAQVDKLARRERLHTVGQADAIQSLHRLKSAQQQHLAEAQRYAGWAKTWEEARVRAGAVQTALRKTHLLYDAWVDTEPKGRLSGAAWGPKGRLSGAAWAARNAARDAARKAGLSGIAGGVSSIDPEHGRTAFYSAAEIQDAIDAQVKALVPGDQQTLAVINGFTVVADWTNQKRTAPLYYIDDAAGTEVGEIQSPSIARITNRLNGMAGAADAAMYRHGEAAKSMGALESQAKQDFPQRDALLKKRLQLAKLEDDLQANPIPPPAWLRFGAPLDSDIYVNGEKRIVRGHRMGDDYSLTTDEGDVPYMQAKDENGQPLFEQHPLPPPPKPKEMPGWAKTAGQTHGVTPIWSEGDIALTVGPDQFGDPYFGVIKKGLNQPPFNSQYGRPREIDHKEWEAAENARDDHIAREANRAALEASRAPAAVEPEPAALTTAYDTDLQNGTMSLTGGRHVADDDSQFSKRRKGKSNAKPTAPVPPSAPDTQAARARLIQAATGMMRFMGLPEKVGLALVNSIPVKGTAGADAMYQSDRALITYALDTDASEAPVKIWHEAVHALMDPKLGLLTDGQRKALIAGGKRWLYDGQKGVSRRQRLADIGYDSAKMVDEAIARLAEEALQRGMQPRTLIGGAFERMQNFAHGIGQVLHGEGYLTAEDVMRGLMRGEQALPGSREAMDAAANPDANLALKTANPPAGAPSGQQAIPSGQQAPPSGQRAPIEQRIDEEFPPEGTPRSVGDVLGDQAGEQYAMRRRPGMGHNRGPMETAKDAVDDIQWLFSPTSRGAAKDMERVVRGRAALQAQSAARTTHALERFRHVIGRLPEAAQLNITDRMERGLPQASPQLQAVADAIRAQLDLWTARIQSLPGHLLDDANEFYMGRIYSNHEEWAAGLPAGAQTPQQAVGPAIGAGLGKSPMRGSGNFMKRRGFEYQSDAIHAGLKPVTANPIEMQTLKLREMQRFYHGTKLGNEIKDAGLARWVPVEQERRAQQLGLVMLKDPFFQPKTREAAHGDNSHGNWYAPEMLATIFNNYVSAGIAGNFVPYDMMRVAGNALNQLQLGLSGFHATFIGLDTMTSRLALGLQQLSRGDVGPGVVNAALGFSPWTIASTIQKGSKLRSAYLDPQNATPEWRKLAQMLNAGGGRINMDMFYRSNASGSFFKNLTDLKNPDGAFREAWHIVRDTPLTSPFRLVGRVLETITEPLMGQMVPRAKLGVFAMLAQDWLRRNPNASPTEASDAMIKFWDSVDNRMGQMVYDNVFWHKGLKDIAFVVTRSVGWNFGTIREIAGAGVDTVKQIGRMARGQTPELTARMAYTIAMTVIAATLGAIMTYLFTGHGPQEMLDYFYPPTGQVVDGVKQRWQIPGYIKDVRAWAMAPFQTLANKSSPLLSMAQQVLNNRDYYGSSIYDSRVDNPAVAYSEYLLNQALPFSFRAQHKLSGAGAGMLGQSLAFWGVNPAPASITDPARAAAWQERHDNAALRNRAKHAGDQIHQGGQ
jgi:N12 class adenine-specific DNA methylase